MNVVISLAELFYTEKAHVRNLKVMQKLFQQPLLHEPWIPDELVRLLFPNIEEMIKVHSEYGSAPPPPPGLPNVVEQHTQQVMHTRIRLVYVAWR